MSLLAKTSPQFPKSYLRLNRICPYFTRFPLQFPLTQLREASPGQWVLDPFCGAGATLFAARLMGLHAVGIDSNPVAVAIARAKLRYIAPEIVIEKAAHVLACKEPVTLPEGVFWEQCYTPDILEALCRFRSYFMKRNNAPADIMLRAVLLGLLHGPNTDNTPRFFSNCLAADYAPSPEKALSLWKEYDLKPPACNVLKMIQQRAMYLLSIQLPTITGVVKEGDSRRMCFADVGHKFDWIITSPPYYGMNSYTTDQWIRNWFLGGPAYPEKKINTQVSQQSPKAYTRDLATVWKHITPVCNPGARLIVRIGNVPGVTAPPAMELFQASLEEATLNWKIENSIPVQSNTTTKKTVSPFVSPAPWPENETEVFVRLTS